MVNSGQIIDESYLVLTYNGNGRMLDAWILLAGIVRCYSTCNLVSLTGPPADHRLTYVAIGVGVVSVIFLVLVVSIVACCFMNYRSATKGRPLKKRIVIENVLYSFDHPNKNVGGAQSVLLLPQVKIEGRNGWYSSHPASTSEYEIPLDRAWEFPRDRWPI